MSNSLARPARPDPSRRRGLRRRPPARMGFFTDTSVCIGCKACEVACKEWNARARDGGHASRLLAHRHQLRQHRRAGRRHLAARGVHRADRPRAAAAPSTSACRCPRTDGDATEVRWLMASDVCKHCTHAACLDVCPTGALIRTEFGTVVVQEDVCNGCGYCVPACPYGVIDQRKEDGRALEVHDVLRPPRRGPGAGLRHGLPHRVDPVRRRSTSCGSAPTPGVETLHARGVPEARLYGARPRRRGRRRRRVLPAARRARGLRAAAGPGRHDPRPARACGGTPRAAALAWPPPWPPRSWAVGGEPAAAAASG